MESERLELVTDDGDPITFKDDGIDETLKIPHSEDCCEGCKATLNRIDASLQQISQTFTEGVNGAVEQLAEGGLGGLLKTFMGR
ncbi:MAG: hypothetical protein GY771_05345 [bacterium]|nr:hypothetical protein [bacterium]